MHEPIFVVFELSSRQVLAPYWTPYSSSSKRRVMSSLRVREATQGTHRFLMQTLHKNCFEQISRLLYQKSVFPPFALVLNFENEVILSCLI